MNAPTVRPPGPETMNASLARNIQVLAERRRRESAAASLQDRVADAVTRFSGSMAFVYAHLVVYGAWIAANLGLIPDVPQFDKSFVILATEASVEAIFLSTFVLISQNRMARAADQRADLDLHVSLLAEHELTKLAGVVAAIAAKMGVSTDPELHEIEQDVAPEAVLDEIEAQRE